jgi:alpha-L-rhamnosidase
MAEQTGTLWENMSAHASCNHGFASYLGHVLYRDVLGISNVDYLKKEVTVRFTDIQLNNCSGTIPIGDAAVSLQWERQNGKMVYSLQVPDGFNVKVENISSSELVKK